MQSISLIALLVLVAGASAQCWGGNCGGGCYGNNCGCNGNNCGGQVTVLSIPNNNNGCSCNSCYGNGCAPRCSYCPNNFGYSNSCCNNNNFSCCGYRFRRSSAPAIASETSDAVAASN
ncbi:hypothetical protein B9Z55_014712 [Caenorhabditis nigoni]|uniref:CC domain-containing protein n=1 Tax=Caenorhabditis nigoni TaxID=1611254 RepID=A0A2G5U701_9PELO|nr:hypothetical protein B9Z55_014712 [Caenorhabditis nigoni]